MTWLVVVASVFIAGVIALSIRRRLDRHSDRRIRAVLIDRAGSVTAGFDPASVESLPEPAQRYFRYTIRAGAPLHRAVEIDMHGELGFGTKDNPDYRPMFAREVLVPPYGLVWTLKAGMISGSDGAAPNDSWTRFWLFGLLPIVRVGGNPDHRRSAFGRVVAEGAFWSPASLLPGESVRWEPLDGNRARAIVSYAGLAQAVDITVAGDGRPTRVEIRRWSNENPDRTFREQPFGGDLADFREFDGYRLPTTVEGGNHIGTADYFPFFRAKVTAVRFPGEVCPT